MSQGWNETSYVLLEKYIKMFEEGILRSLQEVADSMNKEAKDKNLDTTNFSRSSVQRKYSQRRKLRIETDPDYNDTRLRIWSKTEFEFFEEFIDEINEMPKGTPLISKKRLADKMNEIKNQRGLKNVRDFKYDSLRYLQKLYEKRATQAATMEEPVARTAVTGEGIGGEDGSIAKLGPEGEVWIGVDVYEEEEEEEEYLDVGVAR